MSVSGGTHVPYGGCVTTDGHIDRAAWAELVNQLVLTEANGNQSKFAALADVTPKTVGRWLRQENDVSEQSVRDVARRLNRDPMELLVTVGYYAPHEARRQVFISSTIEEAETIAESVDLWEALFIADIRSDPDTSESQKLEYENLVRRNAAERRTLDALRERLRERRSA